MGVVSPFSRKAVSRAVHGKAAGEWTDDDARGCSRLLALPGMLALRAGTEAGSRGTPGGGPARGGAGQ